MKEKINYVIRKVEPKDARQFIELHNFVWKSAYKDIFPAEVFAAREAKTERRIAGFADHFLNNNEKICYVAELDGRLIGLMAGNIKSLYSHFGEINFADLNAMYIHPDFQHIGIGTKFKDIFVNWAKENGAKKFVIGVLKDNTAARKSYEAWGGKLDDFKNAWTELGKDYEEVFYTYDLEKEKTL